MKLTHIAIAAAALLTTAPTMAAFIVTSGPDAPVNATAAPLTSGTNLNNNNMNVFIYTEGTAADGSQSFLLHFNPTFYALRNGSFSIQLGANEYLDQVVTSSAGLFATDRPIAGVTQSTDANRGLEDPSVLFYGDTLTRTAPNPIRVTFNLRTGGISGADQARFIIRSVPEPTTWAMMLAGFGLVGFGLRRRRKSALRLRFA